MRSPSTTLYCISMTSYEEKYIHCRISKCLWIHTFKRDIEKLEFYKRAHPGC